MGESARGDEGKLLVERAVDSHPARGQQRKGACPARSVTVNLAESPLGWLHAHGHVTKRQYDAGERPRFDWERSQLDPRVTVKWDAAPISGGRGGAGCAPDLNGAQIERGAGSMPRLGPLDPG